MAKKNKEWVKGLWNTYEMAGFKEPHQADQYSWFAEKIGGLDTEDSYSFSVQTDHIEQENFYIELDEKGGVFRRNFPGSRRLSYSHKTRQNRAAILNVLKIMRLSNLKARLIETNGGRYSTSGKQIYGRVIEGDWILNALRGNLEEGFDITMLRMQQ